LTDRNYSGSKPKSTAEKLQMQREKAKEFGDIAAEEVETYKKALNSMAASEHGKIVLKTLIKACGVFSPDRGGDVSALIRQSERRNVYLEVIRPFINPELRQELER